VKRKTSGLQLLWLSLMSFNGSGYADYSGPEEYLESYKAYKTWKKDSEAVDLVTTLGAGLVPEIKEFISTTSGAGRTPSDRNLKKFSNYYSPAKNW
jgi:hypothetical protein